jgi:hypothetical protein
MVVRYFSKRAANRGKRSYFTLKRTRDDKIAQQLLDKGYREIPKQGFKRMKQRQAEIDRNEDLYIAQAREQNKRVEPDDVVVDTKTGKKYAPKVHDKDIVFKNKEVKAIPTLSPRESNMILSGELGLPKGSIVAGGKVYTSRETYEQVQKYEREKQKYEREKQFRKEQEAIWSAKKQSVWRERYSPNKTNKKKEMVQAYRPRSQEYYTLSKMGLVSSPEMIVGGKPVNVKSKSVGYDLVSVPKSQTTSIQQPKQPKNRPEVNTSLMPVKEGKVKSYLRGKAETAVQFWQTKERASQERWAPYWEKAQSIRTLGGRIKKSDERRWWSPVKATQEVVGGIQSIPYLFTEMPASTATKLYASTLSQTVEYGRVQREGKRAALTAAKETYSKPSTYIFAATGAYFPAKSRFINEQLRQAAVTKQKTARLIDTKTNTMTDIATTRTKAKIFEPSITNFLKGKGLMKQRTYLSGGGISVKTFMAGDRILSKGKQTIYSGELVKGRVKNLKMETSEIIGETWQNKIVKGKDVPRQYRTELDVTTKTTQPGNMPDVFKTSSSKVTIFSREEFIQPQSWFNVGVGGTAQVRMLFGGRTKQSPIKLGRGLSTYERVSESGRYKYRQYESGTLGIGGKFIDNYIQGFDNSVTLPNYPKDGTVWNFRRTRVSKPFEWIKREKKVTAEQPKPILKQESQVISATPETTSLLFGRSVKSFTGSTILKQKASVYPIIKQSGKSKTTTRTKPTSSIKPLSTTKPIIRTQPKSRSTTMTRTTPIVKSLPITSQKPTSRVSPTTRQRPIQNIQPIDKITPIQNIKPVNKRSIITRVQLNEVPPPPPPPGTGWGSLPPPYYPSSEKKTVGGGSIFKPSYMPSVEALFFGIKGKKPKEEEIRMGLNLRPIL